MVDNNKAEQNQVEEINPAPPRDADSLLGKDKAAQFLKAQGEDIVLTPQEDKRVLRKIDWRIMPLLLIIYSLQFLDKTTLSYASVFGVSCCSSICDQGIVRPSKIGSTWFDFIANNAVLTIAIDGHSSPRRRLLMAWCHCLLCAIDHAAPCRPLLGQTTNGEIGQLHRFWMGKSRLERS